MNADELWPDFDEAWLRVRRMQAKLYLWATRDTGRVFDDLHNLVCDPAFLVCAWQRVHGNTGGRTAGVDGVAPRSIPKESTALLSRVRIELRDRTFRPDRVREKLIPKPGNPTKKRRLGIPTTVDRIVQAALKLVLEPIFEAGFQSSSYGFRPRRRAQDAIAEIHLFGSQGYHWVLEADIEACFDRIDHSALMKRVRGRIDDKRVLALIKSFLKAGVLGEDGLNRDTRTGTPQGGILSPLLANIALSVLDDHYQRKWDAHGEGGRDPNRRRKYLHRTGKATYRLVRFADDFVVLVHGGQHHAEQARTEVAEVLRPMGLTLSPEKTRVVHIDSGFDFLGWRIQRRAKQGTNRRKKVIYTYPSKKSLHSIIGKVRVITCRSTTNKSLEELLKYLNLVVRGWCMYFRHGVSSATFPYLRRYMWREVGHWMKMKHRLTSWPNLRRRYSDPRYPAYWPAENGTVLYDPAEIVVERYRWRGYTIPTPWSARAEQLEALAQA
ncbi:group II intron reverse transcriptase/maturase [Nocardia sp. alder85J]|uniref:group II intron reverse transcriptase/maturase n=1 Tax=Nocardia sp. alder85J TaxID=2862949 RepID=UPI001CD355C5|nr:group II intron reverse transcriptase/maturase [Nocardia sp. alder85J]MCX4099078.1 group II intron reverse transcriptase/maturase [Nocardia sp. alder85J]